MNVFKFVSILSSFPAHMLLLLLVLLFDRSWFFLPLLLAYASITLVVYYIKWIFPKPRPAKARRLLPKKKTLWNHWRFVEQSSFPSAHTAYAAALTVLCVFMAPVVLKMFTVLFVIAVGYSRIYLKEHFLVDVLAGAGIGIVLAVLAWNLTPVFIF